MLYELICIECNKDDEVGVTNNKQKLSGISWVYVGETARSTFGRSREHWADRVAEKEYSHMIKHRQIDHPEQIDLRGSGVLNSRSEYSRCRLPRLMIDMEE